ncbi:MAG: nucleotide excision repair endonuclease [Balneolaceae bacterium]|nr:nucleotide excision repair endonuclease [Balneolaceae bacterium]
MNLDLFEPIALTQKERVNAALPDELPHSPGVYTMYDAKDQVLYVGKAKDIQKRLVSYRYSKSKKVIRMIAHLHRIGIEECKNETDAILLENLLIRSLRPPFNEANKKPETYYYISTTRQGNKREFRLSMRPLNDYPKTYGCFKGHLRVRKGLGALLKLLYVTDEKIDSACYLPTQLLKRITPMRYAIPLDDQRGVQVHQLLKGTSAHLLEEFEQIVDENPFRDRFTNKYFASEVEHLRLFYELGPARNQLMKRELNLESEIIPQDQLDDLQVLLAERLN